MSNKAWTPAKIDIVKSVSGYTSNDEELIECLIDLDMRLLTPPPNIWTSLNRDQTAPNNPSKMEAKANPKTKRKNTEKHCTNNQDKTNYHQDSQEIDNKDLMKPIRKRQKNEWYTIYPTPKTAPNTPPNA